MRKRLMRILAICLAALLYSCSFLPAFAEDANNYSYTYNYDYWEMPKDSPDVYRVLTTIDSGKLGLDLSIKNPQSIYTRGNDLYLCDTGNNRILQIRIDQDEYALVRVIDKVNGAEPESFNTPYDIFVDPDGTMYVCDQGNGRIVKMDKDCNHILSFLRPTDETFDPSLSFLPTRAVVDASGRVYAICKNVNKGFVKYESDGSFTGFFGAMEAKYTWYDYVWKLLSTKEQRAQTANFVPTEYENACIDSKGFIFATITNFKPNEVTTTKPIRRINSVGTDILIRNGVGTMVPQGDVRTETQEPSRLVDITVLDNGIYIALDRIRGRLFGYDSQGNMLWAFGSINSADGFFRRPAALDHIGYNLLVLDNLESNITIFTPTEYGQLIYTAMELYLKGKYDDSAQVWQQVLAYNGNYDMAYVGIGRAQLRKDMYKEAMENFKIAKDAEHYAEAFQLYRKEWVEDNITWLVTVFAALLIVPRVWGRIKKVRELVKPS